MEPTQEIYLPFLQPLIEAPGSRYHLRHYQDVEQWQPQRYVLEGLIPDAKGHGGPPSTEGKENSSILITANLALGQLGATLERKFSVPSHRKVFDFILSLRQKSGFQSYGPTRLLLWLPESERRTILPKTVGERSKLAMNLEMTCDVEEVVQTPYDLTYDKASREDAIDIESAQRVARRMKEMHVQIPSKRQPQAQDAVFGLSATSRGWHYELLELEERVKTGTLQQFIDKPSGPIDNNKNLLRLLTPEFKRLQSLRRVLKGENNVMEQVNKFLIEQKKIDKLYLEAHREMIDAKTQVDEFKVIDSKVEEYKHQVERMPAKYRDKLNYIDDDRRAFAMSPPLLLWDRRSAEPLMAEKDEFYNPKAMSLLDLRPTGTNDFHMNREQTICFDYISTNLLGVKAKTVKHLNRLAPGAYEALIPHVPALQDPSKGGRRDLESLRVRTFTSEMFHALAMAWDNWLFKPSLATVLQFGMDNDPERGHTEQKRSVAPRTY